MSWTHKIAIQLDIPRSVTEDGRDIQVKDVIPALHSIIAELQSQASIRNLIFETELEDAWVLRSVDTPGLVKRQDGSTKQINAIWEIAEADIMTSKEARAFFTFKRDWIYVPIEDVAFEQLVIAEVTDPDRNTSGLIDIKKWIEQADIDVIERFVTDPEGEEFAGLIAQHAIQRSCPSVKLIMPAEDPFSDGRKSLSMKLRDPVRAVDFACHTRGLTSDYGIEMHA